MHTTCKFSQNLLTPADMWLRQHMSTTQTGTISLYFVIGIETYLHYNVRNACGLITFIFSLYMLNNLRYGYESYKRIVLTSSSQQNSKHFYLFTDFYFCVSALFFVLFRLRTLYSTLTRFSALHTVILSFSKTCFIIGFFL